MLRLVSDADFNGRIIDGLQRRLPEIDLIRVQEVLPDGTPDPEILEWAAAERRVLLTNDRQTMIAFAYERVGAGHFMPGVIVAKLGQKIGSAIDDLAVITQLMSEEEIRHRVIVFLPFK